MRRAFADDFDEALPYTPREDRLEWAPVGLLGKLAVRHGQPVGDRWIDMGPFTPPGAADEFEPVANLWLVR